MLNESGSKSVLDQVNSWRSAMSGVNRARIPDGTVTVSKNGDLQVETPGGAKYGVRANGTLASCNLGSNSVGFLPNGKVGSVRSGSMSVSRTTHGATDYTTQLPDKTNLVAFGRDRGYTQTTVAVQGQNYRQRAWLVNGKVTNRLYKPITVRGASLFSYIPSVYYPPAFYLWTTLPWDPPVPSAWNWDQQDWYSYYSAYFAPLAQYSSAADWLTDYVIARSLSDNYTDDTAKTDSQPGDNPRATGMNGISDDVKAAMRAEVQNYLTQEGMAAAGADPSSVGDFTSTPLTNRTFLFWSWRDYTWADESTCNLSPGDVIQFTGPIGDDNRAPAIVLANKAADCSASQKLNVSVSDVENMFGNLRVTVDAGLQELQAQQGQNGIPAAPAPALVPARSLVPAPPPDMAGQLASMLTGLRADGARSEPNVVASTCPAIR